MPSLKQIKNCFWEGESPTLNLPTSLANEDESWTVYSFSVKGFKTGTRILPNSYVGLPMEYVQIWRKDGQLSSTGLSSLACP